jgi:hypothetical protein
MQHIYSFSEICDIEDSMGRPHIYPYILHSQADARHWLPVTRGLYWYRDKMQLTAFLDNGASAAAVKRLMGRLHGEGIAVAIGHKIEYKIPDGKK